MTFGPMPIANGFLNKEQFSNEYIFEMEVAFCDNCKMFQLVNQPKPEQMFNENYAFFSGTSMLMANHFEKFANNVMNDYLKDKNDPFVVEIGSNDGIMLKNFAQNRIRHLGIEPSANVSDKSFKPIDATGVPEVLFILLYISKKLIEADDPLGSVAIITPQVFSQVQ